MKVKCFGIAKDITNTDVINVEPSEILQSVADLKNWISVKYPEFKNIKTCMIAVNQEYAEDGQTLTSQDEIAIIPPVSGG